MTRRKNPIWSAGRQAGRAFLTQCADAGIQETIRRLTDYYRFQTGNDPVESNRPYAISPHLVAHHLTTSSFYAIVSNSGKAR